MTLHDILYWQRYFCEDAGWRLQVGAALILCQISQCLGVVGNLVELQHLFCTVKAVESETCYDTVVARRVLHRLLDLVVELQLGIPDIGYVSDTTCVLDIETWTNLVEEIPVGLEVLRVIHEGIHHVRTVVLVGLAILCLIWLVQIDLESHRRAVQVIGGARLIVVLAHPVVLEGIIV